MWEKLEELSEISPKCREKQRSRTKVSYFCQEKTFTKWQKDDMIIKRLL